MANFDIAYKKLVKHEGGYVNDPKDNGGETYKGISRKFHPDSTLWVYIDEYKRKNIPLKNLENDDSVQKIVKAIYKNDYWDVFDFDDMEYQSIAEEIFDDAVNRGVKSACILASTLLGMSAVNKPTDELLYNLKHLKR